MNKIISGMASVAVITFFLAVLGVVGAIEREILFPPPNSVKTAVSVSTADKQIQAIQTVRTQAYEPQDTYINRIPDDAKQAEIPEDEIIAIARMMYGECNSSWIPIEEKAAVCWVVCNRVDSEDPYFPDTIIEVVTQKGGFYGYSERNPVTPELYEIALDVLKRWYSEYDDMPYSSGRVLPKKYTFFTGDGYRNIFRDSYCQPYNVWDFSLESPYENQ